MSRKVVVDNCVCRICAKSFHLRSSKIALGRGVWAGKTNKDGYGIIRIKRQRSGPRERMTTASRVAYEAMVGPIPPGFFVCHRCDNPTCINPVHLFLGTPNDNSKDMVAKGRQKRGEQKSDSKLTEKLVREIRERYQRGGITHEELAREFGVGRVAITLVIGRRRWKHVD